MIDRPSLLLRYREKKRYRFSVSCEAIRKIRFCFGCFGCFIHYNNLVELISLYESLSVL